MSSHPAQVRQPALLPVTALALLCLLALAIAPTERSVAPGRQAGQPAGPTAFIPNHGQLVRRVRYYAQTPAFSAYFTARALTLDLHKGSRAAALVLSFAGANPRAAITAGRRERATVSYLTGRRHFPDLPTFGEVRYHDLWPGIDLVFRSGGEQLKYEFHLKPGADPSAIRVTYAGADSLALDQGALVVGTPLGPLRDARPVARQDGHSMPSAYALHGSSYGFTLGRHDPGRPLVIDPGLAWSTYLGGSGEDDARGVATDPQGNAYVAGRASLNFPTTPGAYGVTANGRDVFVSKFSPDGALVYSTYLGGSGGDYANGLAVDAQGSAYVAGTTSDPNFPTTPGAYRSASGITSNWRYVTKLNPQGSGLVYSTLVGDVGLYYYSGAIAVDSQGAAYTTGYTNSTTYPTTPGSYQPTPPASGAAGYLSKLNPTGTGLDYSTYMSGGSPARVAVDASGNAYLTGTTGLGGLPTTAGSYDPTWNGGTDVFVSEFNGSGSALVFSTYIGGSGDDVGMDLKVDGSGIYVTGYTAGYGYPTTPGAFGRTSGARDAFVTKLNPSGSGLVYSTLIGGSDDDFAGSIDLLGKEAVITGNTSSVDFPVASADAVGSRYAGGIDSFVTVLNDTGSGLVYSSYLGGTGRDLGVGVATDSQRNVYVSGETNSTDYPTTPGAYATTNAGAPYYDVFLTKIGIAPADAYVRPKGSAPALFSLVPANTQCIDATITHGAPLSYPSCPPPQLTSSYLTTGTPDANGKPIGMQASLLMRVHVGDPATPANEADVRFDLHVTDVLTKALSPYTGGLRALMNARITDKDPAGNATTIDFPFGFNASCVPDPDPTLGSSCDAATSVNAVIPGAVQEGRRAVWGLDRVRVFDGGPDGDPGTSAGNTQFLTQGLFVP